MQLSELAGKQVVIWGAGREASAVISAIRRAGVAASVIVTDESVEGKDVLGGCPVLRGAAAVDALAGADVVIRSPGVSPYRPDTSRLLSQVPAHTTATRLWFASTHAPVIGVTGTKGKSTTASLIAHLLNFVGVKALLAGNIGRSPLDHYGDPQPSWWVLELSSYQTSDLDASPEIGVLTSLSPEHLDWHGGYDAYVRDKLNLFVHRPDIRSIVNVDDPGAAAVADRLPSVIAANSPSGVHLRDRTFYDGDQALFTAGKMQLIGRHNRSLAATALAAVKAAGVDLIGNANQLEAGLAAFAPLEHRLQPVAEVGGVTWVDDGLSTTPVATMAALDAFADRPATVLVGGHDRGLDYDEFAEYVAANTERLTIVTMPDSGERIAEAIARRRQENDRPLVHCADGLEEAVRLAAQVTPRNGVVLLSPAAPSFGRFTSYVERSRAFVEAVKNLPSSG